MRIKTNKIEKLAIDEVQQFINALLRARTLGPLHWHTVTAEVQLGEDTYEIENDDLAAPKTISKLLNELDKALKSGKQSYNHRLHIYISVVTGEPSNYEGKVRDYLKTDGRNINSGETLDMTDIIAKLNKANNDSENALRKVHDQGVLAIVAAAKAAAAIELAEAA